MTRSAESIARALGGKKCGQDWLCRCPVPGHEDNHPSFYVGERGGETVWICRAGCDQKDTTQALRDKGLWHTNGNGFKRSEWKIRSAGGAVYTKIREDPGKKIRWQPAGANTKDLLYIPEQYRNGYDPTHPVYICEGEKDTDAAVALGLQAAGTVGGANNCPSRQALASLDGLDIVLWPDADEPGRKHMREIAKALARPVRLVDLDRLWPAGPPDKGAGAADLPTLPEGGVPTVPVQAGRRLKVHRSSEVESGSVEWLIEPYLPRGEITLLGGDPGTGKSYLSLDFCASLSHAGLNSMYLVFEDSLEHTMAPRLKELGADMDRVFLVDGKVDGEDETAFTTDDLDLLDEALGQNDISLVVIDPVQAFTPAGLDTHKDNQVRGMMTPLFKLAVKHNAAIVVVMHLRKPPSGENRKYVSMHDFRGSGDYVGAARNALAVARKPTPFDENARSVFHVKHNVGPEGSAFEFSFGPDGYRPISVPRAGGEIPEVQWT